MSVDLKSNTAFARISLIVMDDSLIKLEHSRTNDRVRRFMFDSIERIIIWRTVPGVRIALCAVCLVAPALLMLIFDDRDHVFLVIGLMLGTLGLGLIVWYLVCRKTTIRIVRAGTAVDIVGIFRPKKVRNLRDKLIAGILAAQPAPAIAAEPDLLQG